MEYPGYSAEGGGGMTVAMMRLKVNREYGEDLETAFRRRAQALADAPGLLSFEFLRGEEGEEYLLVTRWESREALEEWSGGEIFREVAEGEAPPGFFQETPSLAIYEAVFWGGGE